VLQIVNKWTANKIVEKDTYSIEFAIIVFDEKITKLRKELVKVRLSTNWEECDLTLDMLGGF
jgi:hypothetical protein